MKRPVTVVVAIVMVVLQAALSILVAVNLFAVLGRADPETAGLANAQLLAGLLLTIGIVSAAAVFFVALGWGIARFVILVVGGIQVLVDISASQLTLGDLLWAIAMVLLFLPASNAWFRGTAKTRGGR